MSERQKPRSFADVQARLQPAGEPQAFNQLTFDALTPPEQQELEIENCLVIQPPHMKKVDGSQEWGCTVAYQRDLWHLEEYGTVVLHAQQNAKLAAGLKLKVNDFIKVRGIPWTQEVTLQNGQTHTVNHLIVQDIQVMPPAPRMPTSPKRKS